MLEMIWTILWNVVWPIKGIIYMEEQLIQWGLAFIIAYFDEIGVILVILFGIGMMIRSAHLSHYFRDVRSMFGRFCLGLLATVLNIFLAWIFLIWGAARGTLARTERANTHRVHAHRHGLHHQVIGGRASLHYRFGRWIFRTLYTYVFRFIPNTTIREWTARIVALVIILWGCWNIPYDLTH